ncbi:MAG: TAXI family TRAP transporter solute-binding subunit [Pseudodonghicola sp.]
MSAISIIAAAALAAAIATGVAGAEESALPDTVIWTTYGTGSTTYNQAIAIGSVLKTKAGVNLRLLPGKNDISRLAPVRAGKATFSATGSDSIYAQEAIYAFGEADWGPQPVRILLQNLGNACIPILSIAGDLQLSSLADLRGKRVSLVKSSPAVQKSTEAVLAFAGLSYDDVEAVEVSGYGAAGDALIAGTLDATITSSTASMNTKIQAGPRGQQ